MMVVGEDEDKIKMERHC